MTINQLMAALQAMLDAGADGDDLLISSANSRIWIGATRFDPKVEAKLIAHGWRWSSDAHSWSIEP